MLDMSFTNVRCTNNPDATPKVKTDDITIFFPNEFELILGRTSTFSYLCPSCELDHAYLMGHHSVTLAILAGARLGEDQHRPLEVDSKEALEVLRIDLQEV